MPLLTTVIGDFRELHPNTQVEIVGAQEAAIDAALREGSFDLGIVSCLAGDDSPPEFETTRLLSGQAVVCMHADSPLATLDTISVDELLSELLIVMRSGYVMHRYLHRILDGRTPLVSYSTDGGEMGKLMVAEGLGTTVLPDFSVTGDPLARRGLITWRPLRDDQTEVHLAIRRRRSDLQPRAARDLRELFISRAAAYGPPSQRPSWARPRFDSAGRSARGAERRAAPA